MSAASDRRAPAPPVRPGRRRERELLRRAETTGASCIGRAPVVAARALSRGVARRTRPDLGTCQVTWPRPRRRSSVTCRPIAARAPGVVASFSVASPERCEDGPVGKTYRQEGMAARAAPRARALHHVSGFCTRVETHSPHTLARHRRQNSTSLTSFSRRCGPSATPKVPLHFRPHKISAYNELRPLKCPSSANVPMPPTPFGAQMAGAFD